MQLYYDNFKGYLDSVDELFKQYEFTIKMYDEIETFREWNDPQFEYPYGNRSTDLGSYSFGTFALKTEHSDYFEAYQYENFEYFSSKISMQKSQVCLEEPVFSYISFIFDFVNVVLDTFGLS